VNKRATARVEEGTMKYGVNSKNETIRGMFETIEAAEAVAIKYSLSRKGVEWRVTTAHEGETIVVARFVNGERTGSPSAAPVYRIKGDAATVDGEWADLTIAEGIAQGLSASLRSTSAWHVTTVRNGETVVVASFRNGERVAS
jgi:hypothetical protein